VENAGPADERSLILGVPLATGRALGPPRRIRRRILASRVLALPVLALMLVSDGIYTPGEPLALALEITAFLLLLVGAMGRIWASAYLSVRKSCVLVQDGPYAMIRNPLYLFSFLAHLGAGLAFDSATVAALMVANFSATHWWSVLGEERWLRERFGRDYAAYAESTPRWLPRRWIAPRAAEIAVEPRRFSRALWESSLILLVWPLALAVEWCHLSGWLPVVLRVP
jgi:protein-S-isoprenylcysteine O-methyltransferase Ste14